MITQLIARLPAARLDGTLSPELFRWLNLIRDALHGPFVGTQRARPQVIVDGGYGLHAEEILLNGNDEIAAEGDSVLVVV